MSPSSPAAIPASSRWRRPFSRRSKKGEAGWRDIDVAVSPGISAMQAAAARIGAPLGHDFCAISLSDNLKPWPLVEKRLAAAASADFVIALYNPASAARPHRIHDAFALLRSLKAASTPVVFARAVGRRMNISRSRRSPAPIPALPT